MQAEKKKIVISSFRFYEKKLPDVDDLVMVKVKTVGESAAYVSLIEYNNIEGMVPFTELSRRRIRSISKHIKVGSNEVMAVIRVDKDRGYVDLSKKRVSENDYRLCEQRYAQARAVHSILVCTIQHHPEYTLEDLYTKIGWPMYSRYEHAYEGFKTAMTVASKVAASIDLTDEKDMIMFEHLVTEIQNRMKASAYRIRTEIDLTLYTIEGIDGIKEVLALAEAKGTEEIPIKVCILRAPEYAIRTQTMDKVAGLAAVTAAIEVITNEIKVRGGECVVRKAPYILQQNEEEGANPQDNPAESDESSDENE